MGDRVCDLSAEFETVGVGCIGAGSQRIHRADYAERREDGRGIAWAPRPSSAPAYNSTGTHSRANVEVIRLKAAHLAMIPADEPKAKPSFLKQVEEHFTKWRGVYAAVGLGLAVLGLIAKLFF